MVTVVREFASDGVRAAMPHPEAHIGVRFTRDAIAMHAMGAREHVHRKHVRAGLRIVMVRLPLGTVESVLGISASSIAGTVVPLEDLWGSAARELRARLETVNDLSEAATWIERAIASRVTSVGRSKLAITAADKLARSSVRDVASDLGLSERQFRRVFRDAVGMSPKSFARLARFQRAIDVSRRGASWTRIAAATGYGDQAHLIDEFHAIAGTTPRAFMAELDDSVS